MADYYTTGQVTLTNGSASIVGVGTAWQIANVAGGTIFVEGTGNALPLDVIADDTHATASIEWKGASGTYNYALLRATAFSDQLEANSNIMSRLLVGMEAGTLYRYDASGDLADKATYDDRPRDFAFLAIDVNPAQLFIKASATSGDWRGPFSYGTGPQGEPGPVSNVTFAPVATGAAGSNATMVVTGSGTDADPFVVAFTIPRGNTGEPGEDGTGTGDVKAPATAVTIGNLVAFDATNGKLLKQLTPAQVKTLLAMAASDVTFDNSTAGLAGSPTTVQAAINALAAATGGGKNDALLALEIADLKGSRMGMIGGIADAFDDEAGVNTGGSTNQAYDATNDWYAPSPGVGTPVQINAFSADGTSANSFTIISLTTALVPGVTVSKIGVYSTSARSYDLKIAKRNSAGNFDIVLSVTFAHAGGGWSDFPLPSTFTVPSSGSYYLGAWTASGSTSRTVATLATAVATNVNSTGLGAALTEQTGIAYPMRYEHSSIPSNMTLVSAAYTAASAPSMARAVVQLVEVDAITINTDVTAEVSRDGGTTWTAVTLALSTNLNGVKVYEGTATISGQPSGTSMRWRVKTLNNKNVDVSGVVLQWS